MVFGDCCRNEREEMEGQQWGSGSSGKEIRTMGMPKLQDIQGRNREEGGMTADLYCCSNWLSGGGLTGQGMQEEDPPPKASVLR